ncbi:MAG: adenylate/guanylate cyclase domain-containing protein [Leptolyngbyaceae bacterium]|nr:adenylate/guanylate cyclase domain-containing protein [Leptolyngbyaceae bacterium]
MAVTAWWIRAYRHPDYAEWQRKFMAKRLLLGLQVAVIAYLSFIFLRFTQSYGARTNADTAWLAMASLAEVVMIVCICVLRTPWGQRHPGRIFIIASWSLTLLEQGLATLEGVASNAEYLWTLTFLVQATLIPVRWPLHLISQLGVLAYYYGVNTLLGVNPITHDLWELRPTLYIIWFCSICNISVALYETLKYTELGAQRALHREKERSEQLLLNILPESIAKQLMTQHETARPLSSLDGLNYPQELIADHFADATILFADIVGFTQLSSRVPAEEVVGILNNIFSEFDALAEEHQLEKIKTIGDAYMVVGGLPIEHPAHDHVAAIANMALDMQKAMATFSEYYNRPLRIRIGINTGPVVAGVIGRKKFIYDLWGDAVNLASRMESQGQPDSIQVTQTVYERLRDRYVLEARGIVPIKGKGDLITYWLLARK